MFKINGFVISRQGDLIVAEGEQVKLEFTNFETALKILIGH